jgi:hypothetical protein
MPGLLLLVLLLLKKTLKRRVTFSCSHPHSALPAATR